MLAYIFETMFSLVYKVSIYGGFILLLLLLTLYYYQDRMLYVTNMPSPEMKLPEQNPETFKSPTEHEMEFEDVYVTTKDHIKLHGWFIKTEQDPKSNPTIIFFHANAGNIGFRLPNIVGLVKKSEVNVLIVGYRGYGHSQGKPTEADLKMDTQSVFDWALEHEQINNDKIYLFGRSLGGAVATYLASKTQDKIKGLILENTFTSIPDMVDHIFKYLSALKGLILRIEWNSLELIKELKVPILFISGQADQLIPPFQMQTLYSNAKKSVKTEMMEIEHGTHNESWMQAGDVYFHRIKDFCHEKYNNRPYWLLRL